MAEIDYITVAFGTGTTSPSVNIGNKELVGIQIPSNWVTATLQIQASIDGGASFGTVLTTGGTATPYSIGSVTGGAQVYVACDPNTLRGVTQLQLVAGAAQTNNPTLTLVTRLVT